MSFSPRAGWCPLSADRRHSAPVLRHRCHTRVPAAHSSLPWSLRLRWSQVGTHAPGPQPRMSPDSEAVGSAGRHRDPQLNVTQFHPFFKTLVVCLRGAVSALVKYSGTVLWLGTAVASSCPRLPTLPVVTGAILRGGIAIRAVAIWSDLTWQADTGL